MTSDLRTRASDADRDQTAAALGEHLAAGRLTLDEFDERLDKAYAAKTLGELDDLMADLPGADLGPLPDASPRRAAAGPPLTSRHRGSVEARQDRFSPAWGAAWGSWLTISLLFFVIWLVAGASGSLWFLWVPAILGVLLLRRWIMGGAPARGRRRPARSQRNHRHRDDDQAVL